MNQGFVTTHLRHADQIPGRSRFYLATVWLSALCGCLTGLVLLINYILNTGMPSVTF